MSSEVKISVALVWTVLHWTSVPGPSSFLMSSLMVFQGDFGIVRFIALGTDINQAGDEICNEQSEINE